jgi:hypothetical protein
MNENYKAEEDAMVNVQRIGLITYFKNTVSQKKLHPELYDKTHKRWVYTALDRGIYPLYTGNQR